MTDLITVTGVVGSDPRHTVTAAGLAITNFRLASTRRYFDRASGQWTDGETNWYTVASFRQLALNTAKSLRKGERVVVHGRLRVRAWETAEKSGTAIEIEADSVGHDLAWGVTAYSKTTASKPAGSGPSRTPRRMRSTTRGQRGPADGSRRVGPRIPGGRRGRCRPRSVRGGRRGRGTARGHPRLTRAVTPTHPVAVIDSALLVEDGRGAMGRRMTTGALAPACIAVCLGLGRVHARRAGRADRRGGRVRPYRPRPARARRGTGCRTAGLRPDGSAHREPPVLRCGQPRGDRRRRRCRRPRLRRRARRRRLRYGRDAGHRRPRRSAIRPTRSSSPCASRASASSASTDRSRTATTARYGRSSARAAAWSAAPAP